MKSRTLILVALLAGGGALALVLFANRQPVQPVAGSTTAAVVTSAAEPAVPKGTSVPSGLEEDRLPTTTTGTQPASFSRSSNESVESIFKRLHQKAREGDVNAQFVLYEAANYCEVGYRAYFDRGPVRRTLDEALSWASTRPAVSMEDVKTVHSRCAEWISARSEYGSSEDWLSSATAAGLARAEAATAGVLLAEAEIVQLDDSNDLKRAASQRDEARALMLKALNENDAFATWQVGENLMLLGGISGVENDQAAVWKLAACNQGFDCSSRADWLVQVCSLDQNCTPGETGVQYIRRNATRFTGDLDQAAAQLVERLRRGNITPEEFDSLIVPKS